MKFGVEFNKRTIQKWRLYNINYNELKRLVKEITSVQNSYTVDTLPVSQKRRLQRLYNVFKEQVNYASLFVNNKVFELTKRLEILTSNLESISKLLPPRGNTVPESTQRLISRKMLAISQRINELSADLFNLSRFILLQKIAVQKLFKKFLKHSKFEFSNDYLNKLYYDCLTNDSKSFLNVDLSKMTNQVARLLRLFNQDIDLNDFDTYYHMQSLFDTQPVTHSLTKKSSMVSLSDAEFSSQTQLFDLLAYQNSPLRSHYWIHNDNLNEVRLALYQNFSSIQEPDSGNVTVYLLNNMENPQIVNFNCNHSPKIIDYGRDLSIILPGCGFKLIRFGKLSSSHLPLLLKGDVDTVIKSLDSSSKLNQQTIAILKNIKENNLKIWSKYECDAVRFPIQLNGNVIYLILLSNIVFDSLDPENSNKFPYIDLVLHYSDSALVSGCQTLQSILNSHLCYKLVGNNNNFSISNYILYKFESDRVIKTLDEQQLQSLFGAWVGLLNSVQDIRKLPVFLDIYQDDKPPKSILLNKNTEPAERYWNEFDYGSDVEDSYPNEQYSNGYEDARNSQGVLFNLNDKRVNKFLKVSHKFLSYLGFQEADGNENLTLKSPKRKNNYSSINSHASSSTLYSSSDDESSEEATYPNSSRVQFVNHNNHDTVVTFLYMVSLLLSFLLISTVAGIITALLLSNDSTSFKDIFISPDNVPITVIIVIGLSFGLLLSILSIILLLSRYNFPPISHVILIWSWFTILVLLLVISICLII
ncbi:hypothetical protein PP7435_CHR1-0314 [Komagataella phaffii CBS 7435]|uniref:SPX domain-containing protein n=2 Tax=Komagataella phaffii TaxID=460519 RepID=C4QVV1_KOMPG|nr:uncharacterized protein PAS_chr1-1_0462 [Komagataella phaffii GS115]AOA61321.1 GQ67_02577T0 [Komagataella phaffii]CAH2446033.1 hypothetical protein BQ9382_C1-1635 [Komagataella phaffii CBS 7435]AOA65669.1 GQ68_02671T0 [Komagataella phaffii GS115]CAY67374.1 hypothetical protein PAS_chr1-1_0462 [Komagataella phaffii GS115]CCA36474.1 hypothetical protein PP7435_CHR1-0314 [Komagataella phaffii CBS 7435]